MDNSLYYTFSTIAQSLAALMGLLSAFALFRLQSIDAELRDRGSALIRGFAGEHKLNDLLAKEKYSDFIKAYDEHIATLTISFAAYEKANIDRLRILIPQRPSIVSSLKWAFSVAALTMALSVFVLNSVHLLKANQSLLWAGTAAFCLCLLLQLVLVVRLLR